MIYIRFLHKLIQYIFELLLIILLSSFVSATAPSITWVSPTPSGGVTINTTYVVLNASITDDNKTSQWIDFDNSLVGYWSMDFRNSTHIFDNSTYSNHAEFKGGLGTSNITSGKRGDALEFDGESDYLDITNDASLQISDEMTIEAWIFFEGGQSFPRIADNIQAGDASGFRLTLQGTADPEGLGFFLKTDGVSPEFLASPDVINKSEWTHVAVVYDGTTAKGFVNGKLIETVSGSGKAITFTRNIHIGDASLGHRKFDGKIDEVKLFKRALSEQEILADYNGTRKYVDANFTSLTQGVHNYTAYAIDEDGQLTITDTRNLTDIVNTPPVFDQDLTTQNVTHNTNFNYKVNCSDVDSDPITYSDNTTLFDINIDSGQITDDPAQAETGSYLIQIGCSDGTIQTNQTFTYIIYNSRPVVSGAYITPSSPKMDEDLTCNYSYADNENDAEANTEFKWYRNGELVNDLNSQTVTNGSTNPGENWKCEVRSYDGFYWSDWLNSSTVTIEDPVAPALFDMKLSVSSGEYNNPYNIYANCTDTGGVSVVKVEITDPNSASTNYSMSLDEGDRYIKTYIPPLVGSYTHIFYCEDHNSNVNRSDPGLIFTAESEHGGGQPSPGGGGGGGKPYEALEETGFCNVNFETDKIIITEPNEVVRVKILNEENVDYIYQFQTSDEIVKYISLSTPESSLSPLTVGEVNIVFDSLGENITTLNGQINMLIPDCFDKVLNVEIDLTGRIMLSNIFEGNVLLNIWTVLKDFSMDTLFEISIAGEQYKIPKLILILIATVLSILVAYTQTISKQLTKKQSIALGIILLPIFTAILNLITNIFSGGL